MLTGKIPVGTILYLQDGVRPLGVNRGWRPFTAEEKLERKWDFKRVLESRGEPEKRDNVYLRGDVEAFPFSFAEPREAAQFIELLPYKSPLYHHLRIAA